MSIESDYMMDEKKISYNYIMKNSRKKIQLIMNLTEFILKYLSSFGIMFAICSWFQESGLLSKNMGSLKFPFGGFK